MSDAVGSVKAGGKLWFVEDESIGYYCECGADIIITVGEARECYDCGKEYTVKISVEVRQVIDAEVEYV